MGTVLPPPAAAASSASRSSLFRASPSLWNELALPPRGWEGLRPPRRSSFGKELALTRPAAQSAPPSSRCAWVTAVVRIRTMNVSRGRQAARCEAPDEWNRCTSNDAESGCSSLPL